MRHLVFLSRFIVASFFAPLTVSAVAADMPAERQALSAERREILEQFLESPGNRGVEVRLNARTGAPEFVVRGEAPLARAQRKDEQGRRAAVLEYMAEHRRLFGLEKADAELAPVRELADETGRHHLVFEQHANGVRVFGAEMRAHFDEQGALYAVSADFADVANVDASAAMQADEALYIVRDQFQETVLEHNEPELQWREIEGRYRLVYAVTTMVNTVNRWQTILDADTGRILRHYKDHQDGNVAAYGIDLEGNGQSFQAWERTGRFHLLDVTTPVLEGTEDPLARMSDYGDTYVMDMLNTEGDRSQTVASGSSDSGWDAAGVSAIANGQAAYRYFKQQHGRAGIDGNNGSLRFAIHYGKDYDNAFWNGRWMVFGDGWRRFGNLAACLDVVGHEMSHGVISTTAKLVYENESGAMNESFADVFGVLIEGRNWTLAEGCTKIEPGFMRDMENPHRGLRWQPAHMSEYRNFPNTEDGDWGGVHVNSGILNRAAWLLAEGLTKEARGTSIGRERMGKLYYHALTRYLMPLSEFVDLRRALLLSAGDLYQGDPAISNAIHDAFDAVGIAEGMERTSDSALDPVLPGLLSFSTTRLDFGDVENGAGAERELTIANNTETAITIHDVTVRGQQFSEDFTNVLLEPGESAKGTVTFKGTTSAGTHTDVIEVFTDNPESPQVVDLIVNVNKVEQEKLESEPVRQQSASGGGSMGGLLLVTPLLALFRSRRKIDA